MWKLKRTSELFYPSGDHINAFYLSEHANKNSFINPQNETKKQKQKQNKTKNLIQKQNSHKKRKKLRKTD